MLSKRVQRNLKWIDLECPTSAELRQVMTEYNIHPLVAQELVGPSIRPKVEVYSDFIYLILHFPVIRRKKGRRVVEQQEIDFVIGKNFIITSRYDEVDSLYQFSKRFEVNSILDRGEMGDHAGFVFFYMIRMLYDSLSHELDFINDSIRSIEEHIFQGRERAMVVTISEVSRELLDVRRATNLHKEILESFDVAACRFFGADFAYQTRAIIGEYYKIYNHLESDRDSLNELRETNNSLLNTKQNEIMKTFTILAFVTFPLALAIDIVTIPSESNPLTGHPQAFWIIIFGTLISCIAMFSFFKYKKWL
ncbi:MAG TPA: magnesium transporter CorA family protein [Candidatus Omnitrophota bacterium]|nr:magnesium transporter CorA family protein [Candidatus Omnitrophota bacterium]